MDSVLYPRTPQGGEDANVETENQTHIVILPTSLVLSIEIGYN